MNLGKIMLIDGNSILNRAYFGLQGASTNMSATLMTSDGLPTNAIFGFINILNKFLEEEKPDHLCVAFDMKAPTFRHLAFEGYKAKRKGMPEELAVQLPLVKDVLDAMKIRRMEMEGFEADDILGTLSLNAEKDGMEVIIITGDRDSLQLVGPSTRVKIPTTRGGKTETEEFTTDRVKEKYGVTPLEFIDVKGLMGDPSDNIPGVPGIGEKTAISLIQQFGSIESIYERLEEVSKPAVREKLTANRELAFQSKNLATIDRNMPVQMELSQLKRTDIDREKLYGLFRRLEFKSLIEKYNLQGNPGSRSNAPELQKVEIISTLEALKGSVTHLTRPGRYAVFHLIDKPLPFVQRLSGLSVIDEEGAATYIDLCSEIGEDDFLREFKDFFADEAVQKAGHDLKNLILYLKQKGIPFRGLAFDTMIGAYLLNPSKEAYPLSDLSLDYLGESIKGIETLSGKGKSFTLFKDMAVEELSAIACTHGAAIMKLVDMFQKAILENGQEVLCHEIELPLIEVLADMEYWGFKVNVSDLKDFSSELEGKINSSMAEIHSLAGEEFNINSTKQLGVILFEKLGLPIIKKTKTGYSTDAEVLEELAPMHELVGKILEYRQLVKLQSTYAVGLLALIHPETGKIHSSFNQTIAATGRISSTEPNLQNIPIRLEMGRKIRKVFVPTDKDFILADADYSQIELRVLAHITGDDNMINAFLSGQDIHTSTAAQIFGISESEVTPAMRSGAKAVNFGIVYGIGDFSLAKDLGITRKEARKYIDGYLDRYPNVKKYMQDIVERGKRDGFVTTMFNRRRYLPELQASNFNLRSFGERMAMNTPIQGSAADIIKIAMVRVYEGLKSRNLRSRLILQVHDELIIETFIEEKEMVGQILKESMEGAAQLSAPLSVEVKTGNNWYETK